MSDEELVRSLAVALVDVEHGYTMEYAPSPPHHAYLYEKMERSLRACMKTNRVKLVMDRRSR